MHPVHVLLDRISETVDVACFDQVGEPGVIVDDSRDLPGIADERMRRHPSLTLAETGVELVEEWVATCTHDQPVKVRVGSTEFGCRAGFDEATLALEVTAEISEKFGSGPFVTDDRANAGSLDDPARRDDMFGLSGRDRHDECPSLGIEPHPSFDLKSEERLTNRGPAHVQPAGDVTFADQLTAGKFTGDDEFLDGQVSLLRCRSLVR